MPFYLYKSERRDGFLYLGHVNSFAFECSICHKGIVRNDGALETQQEESQSLGCAGLFW